MAVKLIDVDAFIEKNNLYMQLEEINTQQLIKMLHDFPAQEEIKHAYWQESNNTNIFGDRTYRCSSCGKYFFAVGKKYKLENYCSNCGCKMI